MSQSIFKLREYQIEALDVIDNDLMTGNEVLLQAACGAGKTVTLCRLVNRYFFDSDRRFLILAHKQELMNQFRKTFKNMTDIPERDVGISCSGLNEKNISRRITVATVQTFIGQVDEYKACNLLIIDEAHKVKVGTGSQYDQIIDALRVKNPNMRIVGITATPFRLDHGYIYGDRCTGKNVFQRLNHQIRYDRLRAMGYLMELEGKAAINQQFESDMASVRIKGDYLLDEIGDVMVREIHITTAKEAIDEHCKDFKCVCVFCCTIEHAKRIQAVLGDECTIVHSQLSDWERYQNMEGWKSGKKRIMASVNILVEGFDHPPVDCLVMARPTLSTSLYLQAIGRVLRTSPGKDRAFLLDLTDNTKRFGTDLDNIKVKVPKPVEEREKKERELEKQCPSCEVFCHVARHECPECGYTWPIDIIEADMVPHLTDIKFGKPEPETHDVDHWLFFRHEKAGKPPSLRVEYHRKGYYNSRIASEWICLEHEGYAREKAHIWWEKVSVSIKPPATVDEALEVSHALIQPIKITVEQDGKYMRVIDHIFDRYPEDWDDEFQADEPLAFDMDEDLPF